MNQWLGLALTFSVAMAAPSHALAQSARTADGVAAFVRGDYEGAVELLKPAAESWQMPYDSTALFFMALMYDNGLGVSQDPVRACALLLRTSAPGSELGSGLTFAIQTLVEDLHLRLGPEQMARCMALMEIGFERGGQSATFSLAAGHWISIDQSPERREVMARIEYRGKQSDVEVFVPFHHGVRLLPFTVTELTSLRPQPAPRYFLESFIWVPARTNQWTLIWSVSEVVRDTLVQIAFREVQTREGEQTPHIDVSELRRLATVRVTDGDAEWAVLVPAEPGARSREPRSDVIETPGERQERAATEAARKAADDKVDWALRRELTRRPTFAYSQATEGCWGLLAYGWSADRTEAITFELDRSQLRAESPISFDLAGRPDPDVTVHVYASPPRQWPFCDDVVRQEPVVRENWKAIAGVMSVELSPVFRVREPESYRATIRLTGAEFVSATGARVRQSQPITLSTIVRLPQ
jgi:hypothetical protein